MIAEYTSNYYPVSINGDSLLQQCQDLPKEVNLSINWFKENQSVLESFKRTMFLLSNVQMLSVSTAKGSAEEDLNPIVLFQMQSLS